MKITITDRRENIRRALKVVRTILGIRAKDLADYLGFSAQHLRAVEAARRDASLSLVWGVSKYAGVDPRSMLSEGPVMAWGGEEPFSLQSYKEWVENGRKPSMEQHVRMANELRDMLECVATMDDETLPGLAVLMLETVAGSHGGTGESCSD